MASRGVIDDDVIDCLSALHTTLVRGDFPSTIPILLYIPVVHSRERAKSVRRSGDRQTDSRRRRIQEKNNK